MPNSGNDTLSYLGFQRAEPSIGLATYIDCYWFINRDSAHLINSEEYLHPDGGSSIMLNFGDTLQLEGVSERSPWIFDGANSHSRKIALEGVINAVGIRFKPAGAFVFFSQPLDELSHQTLALDEIYPNRCLELVEKIHEASTIAQKIVCIENWLSQRIFAQKTISRVLKESIMTIENHGGLLTIEQLSQKIGHHQRKIERLFRTQIGITAKEYATTLRMEQARTYIKNRQYLSFGDLANRLGYYDQAHFIKQFKKTMGITPKEYYLKKQKNMS